MRQIGRYRLDSVHGVGAFATVWRGYDPEFDVEVAVKVLADNWAHHADVRERFLEEARLLRRIDDARVVRVHDVGVQDDRPYFVMDFVPGGTLADRVGHVSVEEAIAAAVAACHAVQALHDHDVLHRDVKPSNLLVSAGGAVLVSDLGSAKRLAEASGITVTTGTPAYMAPEQAYGRPLDARTDVYALGVLTHELVTGRLPFDGPLGRTANDRVAPAGAGPRVDAALAAALAVRPEDRPASAAALAELLESTEHAPRSFVSPWLVAPVMALAFVVAAVTTWWLG
ncbi:hypothetical protein AFL01nite_11210 [Aeromicrobium flavum]|uniref:Protein kinase domain-containing protein n=1 Tax=Aeromicrobium flavum TaxID=416568 RepID=A0A512HTM7_9ACTN|nr:serine/threonine-protein kinase [Aeromicrobium flavum]GEO88794.1 hypothetical protein AFL01nite_11210 [Aeromicrobium flavum]